MRRTDRAVTDRGEILKILDRCPVLHLGLCGDNRPYVVPMNFGWEEKDGELILYLHCAPEGKKLDLIAGNPRACFAADCDYKLETAEAPCGWSAQYASVMGEGAIALLEKPEDKERGLSVLMRRYGFEGELAFGREAVAAVAVLKLIVSTLSGKRRSG